MAERLAELVGEGWPVVEVFVEAAVVEPADVLDDRELELASGPPDAVGDELGLEAVEEALSHRIIVGIAGAPNGGEDVVIGQGLGVVTAEVLRAPIGMVNKPDLLDPFPRRERHP